MTIGRFMAANRKRNTVSPIRVGARGGQGFSIPERAGKRYPVPMRRLLSIPSLVVAILATVLFPLGDGALAQHPDIGDIPPPIKAVKWFNWVGDGPSLESLKGRTVLIHFFVCKEPKKANWLTLLKFHHDHADKGLAILAITRDNGGAVDQMLRDYPLPFPVGAASEMQSTWGFGDYGQVILDRNGAIFYRTGASNGTWNGKLLKGLKGCARLKEKAYLRYIPKEEYGSEMKRTIGLLEEGQLGKALAKLDQMIGKETTGEEVLADAKGLRLEVEEHVTRLLEQIERAILRGEALLAREALEALNDDLKRHPLGDPARDRLAELSVDEDWATELEAGERYETLVEFFFRRGWEKNLARFEKLVEDFPETRAAEKMENYWIRKLW
jgi:hypothetical protein